MTYQVINDDVITALQSLPDQHVQCACTSPPYWSLRDYGTPGQLGLEKSPEEYIEKMVEVFREVWRVLRDDGTLWLNIGDSYAATGKSGGGAQGEKWEVAGADHTGPKGGKWRPAPKGLKPKDLCMMPARVALALQQAGWYLRSEIVWAKKSSMPESVTDRPTSAHEKIFLLTKQSRYFYDADAIRQPATTDGDRRFERTDNTQQFGRNGSDSRKRTGSPTAGANLRNVWHLGPEPFPNAHFATYPTEIPRRAILAGTSAKGCCVSCGAPWERIVETEYKKHEKWFGDKQAARKSRGKQGQSYNEPIGRQTIGWEQACDCCSDQTQPCTVLDPFLGSGTTCMVAEQLGRDSIGIELSAEYCEMAEKRIQAGLPLTERKPGNADGLPLFKQEGG